MDNVIEVKDDGKTPAENLVVSVSEQVTTTVVNQYTLNQLDTLIDQYTTTIAAESAQLAKYQSLRDSIASEVNTAVSKRVDSISVIQPDVVSN